MATNTTNVSKCEAVHRAQSSPNLAPLNADGGHFWGSRSLDAGVSDPIRNAIRSSVKRGREKAVQALKLEITK